MSEAGPAIRLRGLRKIYGEGAKRVLAVDGLDLEVPRGEVFGLLGPNGAGKTTTVEICEGLLDPTEGEVEVLGRSWKRDERALRARVGVTLQSTRFFEKQSVRELLELFCAFYDDARPVDQVLDLVGLQDKAGARFEALSGGQQQRVAVASALAGRPELLFLDEPTTGLDPSARRQLWDVVRAFRDEGGTVVLTTHYMEEAAALCDRIVIVDHGRAIAEGTPRSLVESLGAAHVVEIHAVGLERVDRAAFEELPTVHECVVDGATLRLTVDEVHRVLPAVLAAVERQGLELADLTLRTTTLDDVFVHLTGRQLSDAGAPAAEVGA